MSTTLADEQVAQAEIDDDDVLGRIGGAVHFNEEPGGRDLAKRLGNRSEAALGRESLEHVERPLVDREDERLAVVTASDPLLQDLGIGTGVGIGDDPRAERLKPRPQPLDQMGLAVAWVSGHDDLTTGLGLLDEIIVDAEVDVDRLQFIGGEPVGVAVRAPVEPLDEGVITLLARLGR